MKSPKKELNDIMKEASNFGKKLTPNEELLCKYMYLAGTSMSIIAKAMGLTIPELKAKVHFPVVKATYDAHVVGRLMRLVDKGNPRAIIFYLQSRCGWSEKAGDLMLQNEMKYNNAVTVNETKPHLNIAVKVEHTKEELLNKIKGVDVRAVLRTEAEDSYKEYLEAEEEGKNYDTIYDDE